MCTVAIEKDELLNLQTLDVLCEFNILPTRRLFVLYCLTECVCDPDRQLPQGALSVY